MFGKEILYYGPSFKKKLLQDHTRGGLPRRGQTALDANSTYKKKLIR